MASGFLTAGQNYSLTCSAMNVPESLNATIMYVWSGARSTGRIDSVLNFNPLDMSDSDQYMCTVAVISDLLSSPLTDESDEFEVIIQSEFLMQ